jgi:hypothetical protein
MTNLARSKAGGILNEVITIEYCGACPRLRQTTNIGHGGRSRLQGNLTGFKDQTDLQTNGNGESLPLSCAQPQKPERDEEQNIARNIG